MRIFRMQKIIFFHDTDSAQAQHDLDLSGHFFAQICLFHPAGMLFGDGFGARDFLKDLGEAFVSFLNVRLK